MLEVNALEKPRIQSVNFLGVHCACRDCSAGLSRGVPPRRAPEIKRHIPITGPSSGGKMRKLNVLLMLSFACFFASTVRGQSNTGVNDAKLNGNYAFTSRDQGQWEHLVRFCVR